MSWLARSIANSLRLDDEEEDGAAATSDDDSFQRPENDASMTPEYYKRDGMLPAEDRRLADIYGYASHDHVDNGDLYGENNQGRGVKEDLSELRDSLTRQFWGVASFLAPPPPPPPPPPHPLLSLRSVSSRLELKSNAAESGDFDSHEYGKFEHEERESDQFEVSANISRSEDYYNDIIDNAIGITEEVLAFARNIAHHPETWLDFPLSEEEEFDDFEISDAQSKHLLAVELLSPRLAALRTELSPVHMSEGYFWMVYFVLLHSRLIKHDANLLSSPQLAKARSRWMQELQKQTKKESYGIGVNSFHLREKSDSPCEYSPCEYSPSSENYLFQNASEKMSPFEWPMHQMPVNDEVENQLLSEMKIAHDSVVKENPGPGLQEKDMVAISSVEIPLLDDNDDDDWVKEDSDLIEYSGSSILLNEEDISFSDLEDDLDCTIPIKYKPASSDLNTTSKTS